MWECSPGKELAWNILSLFTTSGMLFLEVSLLAFLLQGNIASDPEALTRTFGISGLIVGLDISLKVFLWFTVTCLMIVLIMFKMWSPQNKNENFSFQQAHLVVNLVSIFLLVNMNVLHFHLLFQKKKRDCGFHYLLDELFCLFVGFISFWIWDPIIHW